MFQELSIFSTIIIECNEQMTIKLKMGQFKKKSLLIINQ